MNIAFYSAAAGMQAFQNKLDATANNMANVNTAGYKQMELSFSDLMYTNMNTKEEHKIGHGSKTGNMEYIFQQGILNPTDRALDFAVVGQAYFGLDLGNGQTGYTRDGSFQLSLQDGTAYLVNGDGNYVLDHNGQRITVPMIAGTNQADVDSVYGRLGLFQFQNPYGLQPAGNNVYVESDNTGTRTVIYAGDDTKLIRGSLEMSTAEMSEGMIDVIEAQRAFQLNGRIVSAADQIEEIVNGLR